MTSQSLRASSVAHPADGAIAGEAARRRDLDLLRVLLVFGLVFFHTARIFDTLPLPEGVKNDTTSPLVTLVVVCCALWAMPLMFVIAGFSIRHSLHKRTTAAFVQDRVQRLLVPLIFGALVVVPPQVYVHLLQANPSAGLTYWEFLPRFFDVRLCPDLFGLVCANPASGLFTVAHLWFLSDLFFFSLLLLPLFWYLQRPSGERRLTALTDVLARPGAIWLLALPIVLVDVGFGAAANGGWKYQTFAIFLCCGYLLAADARLAKAMGRGWRSALVVALVLMVIYAVGAFYLSDVAGVDPTRGYDLGSLAWRGLKSVGAWAWMIAILGFGSRPRVLRTLATEHALLSPRIQPDDQTVTEQQQPGARLITYAGEAFLPFYILHQTIVFVIGYYVVAWELTAVAKYLVISLSALATTLLVYDVAVRRTRATRWLFGMRPAH
ncbi:MAG: acyltransferase [Chloroflexales bacterium]|nr:acyltransferase [Chloroflexales bacterium]